MSENIYLFADKDNTTSPMTVIDVDWNENAIMLEYTSTSIGIPLSLKTLAVLFKNNTVVSP